MSSVSVMKQGSRFQAKPNYNLPSRKHARGDRNKITCFSQSSRRSLFNLMAKLKFDKSSERVKFVTLTIPQLVTPQDAKHYLQVFFKRVKRLFPDVAIIWRMEPQRRGAPHFHLLVFGLPYWDKTELQSTWGDVIGAERPFTRIEVIRSKRGVMSYTSKYVAKADDRRFRNPASSSGFNNVSNLTDDDEYVKFTGRFWGVHNRKALPFDDVILYVLPFGAWFGVLKKIAKLHWEGIEVDDDRGFTLFTEKADDLIISAVLLATNNDN